MCNVKELVERNEERFFTDFPFSSQPPCKAPQDQERLSSNRTPKITTLYGRKLGNLNEQI